MTALPRFCSPTSVPLEGFNWDCLESWLGQLHSLNESAALLLWKKSRSKLTLQSLLSCVNFLQAFLWTSCLVSCILTYIFQPVLTLYFFAAVHAVALCVAPAGLSKTREPWCGAAWSCLEVCSKQNIKMSNLLPLYCMESLGRWPYRMSWFRSTHVLPHKSDQQVASCQLRYAAVGCSKGISSCAKAAAHGPPFGHLDLWWP